ncbi:uncharacterized protein LOC143284210 [Babylonia areolata]|uniref:uncharacterized protein LOC143284210 n=1 Tax=Babylonia areolata TaxID=304850 RepID=UPI003FCFA51B
MRPAVHASILRNRPNRPRPVLRPHTFSLKRLLLLGVVGCVIFIPGIVISIVGLENTAEVEAMEPGRRIMYQAIGPALTMLGLVFLFCSCIYYYCYGVGESNRLPGGSHQVSALLQSPPPTIRIDEAPDTGSESEAQDTELLVNGDIKSDDPSPA